MNDAQSQAPLWHDAFYRFVKIDDPEALVPRLKDLCIEIGLHGKILLAEEGINGMLAGTETQLGKIRTWFNADERFADLLYKRTATSINPFKRMLVRAKAEIVPLGLPDVDATTQTGIDVSPEVWREMLQQDDVVVIDNRNRFEYVIGHFKGAIDPGVHNFRDFPDYVENHLDEWEGKKVAMYCTGGIRCEKTTAWLKDKGLEIYQLEGGIINYFAKIPNAHKDYEGECFVFDKRVTLNTRLEETETTLDEVTELQNSLEKVED